MPLDPKQLTAAKLLGKGLSQTEVASQVGVSRRSIVRWLSNPEFKSLCLGLATPQQAPQRALERHQSPNRLPSSLTPQDLVEDALRAVQAILLEPDIRPADRLKAASLVGEWSGLSHRGKTQELEAIMVLQEAGLVPGEVVEGIQAAISECFENVRAIVGVQPQVSQDSQADESSWLDLELEDE